MWKFRGPGQMKQVSKRNKWESSVTASSQDLLESYINQERVGLA
jgi:hypothetical protein